MEGLLIAQELAKLGSLLPSDRLSWRFPDRHTFVLPLSQGALWFFNQPPLARLSYLDHYPPVTTSHSGFQDLLLASAASKVLSIDQYKLDRVLKIRFAAEEGFVPSPETTLILELTGRNCNLILLAEGVILGAAREVVAEVNRFRQIRSGLVYKPPPPYDKLDPRVAGSEELREALLGKPLKKINTVLDGIGPELSKVLALRSGLPRNQSLSQEDLDKVLPALAYLVADPANALKETLALPSIENLRKQEAKAAQLSGIKQALMKETALYKKRLLDIDKAAKAAQEARSLKEQADLIMAYQNQIPKNADEVSLLDFEGKDVTLKLDPQRSPTQHAQRLYEKAKKRTLRFQKARERKPELESNLASLKGQLKALTSLSDDELKELSDTYKSKKPKARSQVGIRYQGPHGYVVIVGRNAKENDRLTFKLARSKDIWLHVQGYTGSHVIIQAQNKEVPFASILFAAQLAAAYSKASGSDNVAVDYTLKKHVWKPKGSVPGAVHYTQQKTVYVTPNRQPDRT